MKVAWGCFACLFEKRKQQGWVGVFEGSVKGQCGENCCRRKNLPAKNWRRRTILPAKFAAKNITGETCGDKYMQTKLPWNSIAVRDKFWNGEIQGDFRGAPCTVVVGGEQRAEIFSAPETLCLQAQKFHREIHYKFHCPKSALAMPPHQ